MSKKTNNPQDKTYQIVLGPNVKVVEDKRSKSKVAHFPFEFPDGTNAVMIICRLKDDDWNPVETISDINIQFT